MSAFWAAGACITASADAPARNLDAAGAVGDGSSPTDAPSFSAWGSPCIGAEHYFCDDVDHDGGFARWDDVVRFDGGSIEIAAPPSGLLAPSLANVVAVRAASSAQTLAQIHTWQAPKGLHCELAILLRERGGGIATPVMLRIGSPIAAGAFYEAELRLAEDGSDGIAEHGLLPDGGELPLRLTPIGRLPLDVWLQLSLDLAIGPAPMLRASRDGTPITTTPSYDLTQYAVPTHEMLSVGVVPKIERYTVGNPPRQRGVRPASIEWGPTTRERG